MPKKIAVDYDQVVGKRVQIVSSQHDQSTKFLNGLSAMVVGVHPIANTWLKLKLDANPVTPQLDWALPANRLVVTGSLASLDSLARFAPTPKAIQ
jgi:hypothetical protein